MSISKSKYSPPLPPLPTQLARGTGAWGQHYLSYRILEIMILLVYLTFIAFVVDPIAPSLNKSIHTIIWHYPCKRWLSGKAAPALCMLYSCDIWFRVINIFDVFLPNGSHNFLERINTLRSSPNTCDEAHVSSQLSNLR